jgi:hypothetical protein
MGNDQASALPGQLVWCTGVEIGIDARSTHGAPGLDQLHQHVDDSFFFVVTAVRSEAVALEATAVNARVDRA